MAGVMLRERVLGPGSKLGRETSRGGRARHSGDTGAT